MRKTSSIQTLMAGLLVLVMLFTCLPVDALACETGAAVSSAPDKAEIQGLLDRYLKGGDQTALPAYPGYHLSISQKLVLEEGQTECLTLLDARGQAVTQDVEWYVYTTVPYDALFTEAESRENLEPYRDGENTFQKDSLVSLADNQVTARTITSTKKGSKLEMFGWIVAVYQGTYGHVLEVQVKEEGGFARERAINQVTANVLRATKDMSDQDKVAYAFDYLVQTITYTDSEKGNYSLYDTLVEGKAVCEGYARAFNYLMGRMGIRSEYKSGRIKTSGGQGEALGDGHAWNRVMIDGKWYYLDATWGDQTPTDYQYLFADPNFLAQSRNLDKDTDNFGTTYIGHRLQNAADQGSEKPELQSVRDLTPKEQLELVKRSWRPGQNKFWIYFDQSHEKEVVQFNSNLTWLYGGYKLLQTEELKENGVVTGTFRKYAVDYQPKSLTAVEATYSLADRQTITKAGPVTIEITLSQPVALSKDSIRVKNGTYDKTSFRASEDQMHYSIEVGNFTTSELQLSLGSCGHRFNEGTVTLEETRPSPQASFWGTDQKSGDLLNAKGAWYYAGSGWKQADSDRVRITLATPGYEVFGRRYPARILVKTKSPMGFFSDTQELYISENRGQPKWVQKAEDTQSGSEILYTAGTEYRAAPDGAWTPVATDSVRNLPAGTYEFRSSGGENMLASESYSIQIEQFQGAELPALTGLTDQEILVRADESEQVIPLALFGSPSLVGGAWNVLSEQSDKDFHLTPVVDPVRQVLRFQLAQGASGTRTIQLQYSPREALVQPQTVTLTIVIGEPIALQEGTRIVAAGYDQTGKLEMSRLAVWTGTAPEFDVRAFDAADVLQVFFQNEANQPIGRKLVYRKVADQASGTQKVLWIEQPQVIR